jgi:hypothetical protein
VARLRAKSLDTPDEVRPTPFGRIDIHNLDDLVIGRMVLEPGWHWMEHVQPMAGTSLCQYHHVGVCVAGRLANRLCARPGRRVGSPGTSPYQRSPTVYPSGNGSVGSTT